MEASALDRELETQTAELQESIMALTKQIEHERKSSTKLLALYTKITKVEWTSLPDAHLKSANTAKGIIRLDRLRQRQAFEIPQNNPGARFRTAQEIWKLLNEEHTIRDSQ